MSWITQGRQEHGYFGHGKSDTLLVADGARGKATQVKGRASYYNLPGNRMANGKPFDGNAFNAAMLDVPLGTKVTVMSLADPSKSIDVTVTDRGPYVAGRVIDLTPKAFEALFGSTRIGTGDVVVVVPAK